MRQRLSKSIKIVFLFSVVFHLFTNCEKNDPIAFENTNKNKFSYKVVSLNAMNELQPVVDNIMQITPKYSSFSRNVSDFVLVENMDTDHVIQITDENGYSTYTFKILNDDETTLIENLYVLETLEGYIAYILSYEPDEDWYSNPSNFTPEGDWYFNLSNFQGEITKYSLEREIIWTTKEEDTDSSSASRVGGFIEVCVFSTVPSCDYGGQMHPWGANCTGNLSYETVETCHTVWSSGGGSTNGTNDGNNNQNGGSNNNYDCNSTGTTIINDVPIEGINSSCTPNDNTGFEINTDMYLLSNELNQILDENDSFVFDETLDSNETLHFNSVNELDLFLEDFVSSFIQDEFEVSTNSDGTKTTKFKGKFTNGIVIPVYLNAHVTSVLDDPGSLLENEYEIEEVTSFVSGVTPFLEWEQNSYEYITNETTTIVRIDGQFIIGVTIDGFNIGYTEGWIIVVELDNQTGENIDMYILAVD
ncbi:hypothetical protein [Psychroserpens jangbogonensis]|uniref:hypothetical protein n=1 Tax=Psychroserpens jangbogonensis TaxID=1484460 RepID=UPI00053D63F5|nr:hypothetical protein [Psychroserpens jangbogonensis]